MAATIGVPVTLPVCRLPSCQKLCHIDTVTGIIHDYCGRTHAAQDAEMHDQSLVPPHGICHVCKLDGCNEPVAYEDSTARVHEFCCKTHADEAIANGRHPPSNKGHQMGRRLEPAEQCALPGCTAPKFRGEFGELYDFCGRTHARLAAARGLEPPPTALGDPAHFSRTFSGRPPSHGCAVCSRSAGSSSGGVPVCQACEEPYTISTLTTAHPKYVRVRAQFLDSWDSSASGPRPTVERVLQVRALGTLLVVRVRGA